MRRFTSFLSFLLLVSTVFSLPTNPGASSRGTPFALGLVTDLSLEEYKWGDVVKVVKGRPSGDIQHNSVLYTQDMIVLEKQTRRLWVLPVHAADKTGSCFPLKRLTVSSSSSFSAKCAELTEHCWIGPIDIDITPGSHIRGVISKSGVETLKSGCKAFPQPGPESPSTLVSSPLSSIFSSPITPSSSMEIGYGFTRGRSLPRGGSPPPPSTFSDSD